MLKAVLPIDESRLKRLDGKQWKALLTLSIVVPVGFLVAFKLTGILQGPATIAETITLEPVYWEFEKSSFTPNYPFWIESQEDMCTSNFYLNEDVNITFTHSTALYGVWNPFYGGGPLLGFRVNLTASVTEGFVDTVRILFREDYNASDVYLWCIAQAPWQNVKWRNLNFTNEWACLWHNEELLEEDLKAFVVAYGANQPKEVEVDLNGTYWILRAEDDVSQQLEATAEVTYFNGTDYVKVALPILINLVADAGESFEDARTITEGSYTGSTSIFDNSADCCKIWLAEDQNITITTRLRYSSVNVSLYDPAETLRVSVESIKNYSDEPIIMDELTYKADTEGYWYIKVESIFDQGLYKLTITVG